MEPLIVLCNFPDAVSARHAAEAVVTEKLAACVNILPECASVYRWQGEVVKAAEVPVILKTTADCYSALEARLRTLHSAKIPEILSIPVWSGLPDYLSWVAESTRID